MAGHGYPPIVFLMEPRVTNEQSRRAVARLGESDNRSAYKNLLFWLLGEAIIGVLFYEFLNHLPVAAQVIILLLAIVVIWYRVDFPKRTTRIDATLLFWFPVSLFGLFCGVMWKITGEDVWVRLGIACICVRAVYRAIHWAGALNGKLKL
jgi:hypothetical protein